MNHRDFLAAMAALALTAEQRLLVSRFAAVIAAGGDAPERVGAEREQAEAERLWEEAQLSGADLARRQREPA